MHNILPVRFDDGEQHCSDDLQLRGLQEERVVESGPREKPWMRPGWRCIRRSWVLIKTVSSAMSGLARLAGDSFRCDHADSVGLPRCRDRCPVTGISARHDALTRAGLL
jgi:hypothetical protein